jgi:type VI secretion system protein ImpA
MPLRDDLLNPIPGPNPAGANLRYAPIFDKIKEARREDDDAPQGEWQRQRKVADFPQVIKLAGETLATKSKDLQLAVWLTEALIKTEGFSGLRSGLDLIRGLIENFWDNLHPELEDGDAELRAASLDWLGSRLDSTLRCVPLAKKGPNWFEYKEALAVGFEAAADTEAKLEARNAAIAEGKLTGEEWEKAFQASPKAYYKSEEETLDAILETLEALAPLCEEKFGEVAPSFGPLRSTVEEIRHTVHGFLQKKREIEPDEEPVAEAVETQPPDTEGTAVQEAAGEPAPARAAARKGAITEEPVDKADAFQRVVAVARFLRRDDPYSPAPYLLLRGLRWGELRAGGSSIDPLILDAPPTEIRQALKRHSLEGDWQQVQELAETAMGLPCGRGWLDLQRYACKAASGLGYEQISQAIQSELNALLAAYPDLPQMMLMDDTPAANPETQAWLKEIAPAPPAAADYYAPPPMEAETAASQGGVAAQEATPPDANELAMEAARSGRVEEAINILTREAAAERSGRGRFQRRLQLAQLCMSIGYERIAHPILEQLAAEIDSRGLEGWESSSMVAHPLALLYRCFDKIETGAEIKQKIYDRICRLDPLQALSCTR